MKQIRGTLELLHNMFHTNTVQHISNIHLPKNPVQGTIIWPHSKNGEYTCKSGYNLLITQQQAKPNNIQNTLSNQIPHQNQIPIPTNSAPSYSTPNTITTIPHTTIPPKVFNTIWNLNCPPKIRLFIWKAILEGLPTFNTLEHRHITHTSTSPQCNSALETASHILFQCAVASQVWHIITDQIHQANIPTPSNQTNNPRNQKPNSIKTTLGDNISHSTKTIYGFTMWHLW